VKPPVDAVQDVQGLAAGPEVDEWGLRVENDGSPRVLGTQDDPLGGPVEGLAPDAIARMVEVNLTAPLCLVRLTLPYLERAGGGVIVNVASLAGMIDPDIGLVTNVRAAHLGAFGSLDDIAAAKGELFALLRDDAVAAINLDDLHVRVQAARHVGRRVTFGQSQAADVRLEELHNCFVPGVTMTFRHGDRSRRLQLRLGGAHAAFNALAALAVVAAVGEDLDAAAERMERLEAGAGRGRVHRLRHGMILVDDSYNSSPAALASILETLRLSEPPGRRVLVMGDMLELGRVEGALHREAGKRAAAAGVKLLVAVGPLSRSAVETARRAGVAEVYHHADSERAAEAIGEFVRDGDLIVVKGSRAMRMERVVEALLSVAAESN